MKTDITSEASGKINQDRAAVLKRKAGHLLVVADGSGGVGGGEKAANMVINVLEKIKDSKEKYMNPLFWSETLFKIDQRVFEDPQAGESTAIVAFTDGSLISGASVGDSEAWLIQRNDYTDLTAMQNRKPLIGSGIAGPMPFGPLEFNGTLLLASDGLFKYASPQKIKQIINNYKFEETGNALVDSVRLKSGTLQDDVTIILCSK